MRLLGRIAACAMVFAIASAIGLGAGIALKPIIAPDSERAEPDGQRRLVLFIVEDGELIERDGDAVPVGALWMVEITVESGPGSAPMVAIILIQHDDETTSQLTVPVGPASRLVVSVCRVGKTHRELQF